MKKNKFSQEQIVGFLQQVEAGRDVKELAREIGVSPATIYGWRGHYGGLTVDEAKRMKALEDENRKLKMALAEITMDHRALKDVLGKMGRL
jgi:putative transposase